MKSDTATLDSIECPNCGHAIPVSEVLSHQIAERARAESSAEIAKLKSSLARKEQDIQERESKLDEAVKARVASLTAGIEQEARTKARGSVLTEIADLKNQLIEASQQRDLAQKAELEARKRARELDERAKNLDLEAARKIDTERLKIHEEATRRAGEQYQLKLAEKEKQIQDAKRANDELKRKLEQGSQQAQGEVLELQLEELLRNTFPMDQIEPVPKGLNGADIVQKVMSRSGRLCGTIVWESKRTKVFSESWLQKLKDDQRKLTAEIAVLVSEALPKDCNTFIYMSEVWVSNPQCAVSLAASLRMQLLNVAGARAAAAGAKQKSEILYEYVVASTQFRQRVEPSPKHSSECRRDCRKKNAQRSGNGPNARSKLNRSFPIRRVCMASFRRSQDCQISQRSLPKRRTWTARRKQMGFCWGFPQMASRMEKRTSCYPKTSPPQVPRGVILADVKKGGSRGRCGH
jgi:hypothetical protein